MGSSGCPRARRTRAQRGSAKATTLHTSPHPATGRPVPPCIALASGRSQTAAQLPASPRPQKWSPPRRARMSCVHWNSDQSAWAAASATARARAPGRGDSADGSSFPFLRAERRGSADASALLDVRPFVFATASLLHRDAPGAPRSLRWRRPGIDSRPSTRKCRECISGSSGRSRSAFAPTASSLRGKQGRASRLEREVQARACSRDAVLSAAAAASWREMRSRATDRPGQVRRSAAGRPLSTQGVDRAL